MDDTILQEDLDQAWSYNSDLMNTMIKWALELQRRGAESDEETADRCIGLGERIATRLELSMGANKRRAETAKKEADNAKKMTHYIADRAIRDAVSRLDTQLRSQTPQNSVVAFVVAMSFEHPQSNDKQRDLEARIKAKMGLSILDASDESKGFAEKVEVFEEKAGELALEFAIEDAKKMIDENMKKLAMARRTL
ncbi:hypothetical protein KCU92_g1724, partial [Aureobasidium melanogenum]